MRPSSPDSQNSQRGNRLGRSRLLLAGAVLAAIALSACQGTTSGKSHYGEFRKSEIYGVGNQR